MTTIDKIAISGIRSYDPNTLVVLKFFKPLTIILGNNGCGKTTIVEALKYVCTGEPPPLSERGRTFVHDPNHCGINLVKAQVKVAFKTRDNKPIIVNASMQLTKKRTKTEFKTIDGTIRMYDEQSGGEIALSHKCADMKKVVPELMGVSRSILENVIFCHQEDADWPLSEAKKLKEKFDEIFATSRWSKALSNINAYRKQLSARHKDLRIDLKVFESNRDTATKVSEDLGATKQRIADCKTEQKTYSEKIAALRAKLEPLETAHEALKSFDHRRIALERDLKHLKEAQKNAHARMQCEYEETDDELAAFLANHDQQIQEKQGELDKAMAESGELETQYRAKQQRISELHQKQGKIDQMMDDFKNKQKEVLRHIQRMVQKYELSTPQTALTIEALDELIPTVMNALKQKEASKETEMEQFQRQQREGDQKLEQALNESVTKKNKFDFRSQELKKQQKESEQKRQQFERQLSRIKAQINDCADIEQQINTAKSKADKYEQQDRTQQWEQQIAECQSVVESNQRKCKELEVERRALQSQSEQFAKMKFKSEQAENSQAKYKQSLQALQAQMSQILGDKTPLPSSMDRLRSEFKAKYKTIQSDYESAQRKWNEMQTQQSVAQSRLSALKRDKQRVEQSLSHGVMQLSSHQLTLDDDISDRIQKAKQAADSKVRDFQLAKCGRSMYSKFNSLAKKKHSCPVCLRDFSSNTELDAFVRTNTNRIQSVEKSGAIAQHEQEVQVAQTQLDDLQSLLPVYQNAKKQQGELQSLAHDFEKMSVQTEQCGDDLEELFVVQVERKSLYEKATTMISRVNELYNQYQTAQTHQQECDAEKQKMSRMSHDGRNLNDVSREYDRVSQHSQEQIALQNKLRQQTNAYDKQKRAALQHLIALQQKSANFDKLNSEQERVTAECQSVRRRMDDIGGELGQLQTELQPMQHDIREKQQQRQQHRHSGQQRERQLHEEMRHLSNELNALQSRLADIQRTQQTVQRHSALAQETEQQQAAFSALESTLTEARRSKEELGRWLDNVVVDKQDLHSNLEYRKYTRQYTDKKQSLSALKSEMQEIAPNAENIIDDIEAIEVDIAASKSKMDMARGGMNSEANKALELMQTLRSEKYKEIDEKYRQQLIKHEVAALAIKDLEKFEKALDKSLIEFHSLKMREINLVLKELWQQTYRGKDIDSIEIVSEIGDKKTASTSSRKNYNYNVVMRQGDATLAMRGRCSAGQRVLASLVIRLALAETFCLNCGVLALDEPTTNLDSKNIEALAYALNQIIARRKRHDNFQLILITHDEDFVEKLGQREHTDGYYRVYKDDSQHSKAKLYKFHQQMFHSQNMLPSSQANDFPEKENKNKRARK